MGLLLHSDTKPSGSSDVISESIIRVQSAEPSNQLKGRKKAVSRFLALLNLH
jgi:negative regulator of replication initiation